jgi:carboxyl-terminal processing protease
MDRIRISRIAAAAVSLVLLFCVRSNSQSDAQISAQARAYLNQAVDIMQQSSIKKKSIDWTQLRSETMSRAAGAQTTADTYEAIRFALRNLNDHHSFLQLSPELRAEDKAARERRQDALPAALSEKWPPSPYIDRRQPGGTMELVDGVSVAKIVVPLFEGTDDRSMQVYAETLQAAVEKLADQKPAGWIVDLRGNLGGNMWPMLAGVGSLEGAHEVGFVIDAEKRKDSWFYDADGVGIDTADGKRQITLATPAPIAALKDPPIVAILIDRGTASSGEAIAVSFQGRPQCRSFGRHTHGQTTANQGFELSDGANLVLTTGVEADRTGRVYLDGIAPDVELPEERNIPAAGTIDPMTRAAVAWIKSLSANP